MSQLYTPTARTWTIHYMEPRDLAQVLRITQKTTPRWARRDFVCDFLCTDTFSWVAEVGGQLAGFLVCRIVPRRERAAVRRRGSPEEPRRFELLHIAVAPEYQRGGVGKSLMGRLEELLARPGACVQAAVPESNLAVQLFLRSLGYKAVRVLRGYYGAENGYAMVWRRAWGATAGPLSPSE